MNIYIGGLAPSVTEQDLRELFAPYGELTSVSVVKDKFSGESRGFGFVDLASKSEGERAVSELNGKSLKNQSLTVNEARPREDRGGRGGSGGGGRGGYGGGGNRGGYGGGGGGNRGGYGGGGGGRGRR